MKDFPISFGIITGHTNDNPSLSAVIHSIVKQNIPEFEIIVVGGEKKFLPTYVPIHHIPFDDTTSKAWITRKKNIITQCARYDTVMYSHDYLALDSKWYHGWKQFGDEWDIAINKIWINENNQIYRHSDFVVNPYDFWKVFPENYEKDWSVGIPYNIQGFEPIRYISGGWWLAKRSFALKYMQDEQKMWGEKEDVLFSEKIRLYTTLGFNPHAITWVLKSNKWKVNLLTQDAICKLSKYFSLSIEIHDDDVEIKNVGKRMSKM